MLTVVGLCLFLSDISRALLVFVAAILSIGEMKRCLARIGQKVILFTPILFISVNTALCLLKLPLWTLAANLIGNLLLTFCICICSEKLMANAARGTLFVLMYPLCLYACVQRILASENWLYPAAVAALGTWSCDAFALFGGKKFGRNKLCPHVSPNKTVEGSICGAAASAVFGILAWLLLKDSGADLWACIAVAVISSTMGQFGDLAASLIKREAGIKDYSNLIPGHGGMMDRADSLLFSIPTSWFCMELISIIFK